MSSLKLNNVSMVYPSGALALYGVNFETAEKELFVILGAEESGKSTLLRVISGLEDVTEGEITVGGKDITDAEVKERDVAFVFRNSPVMPNLNVFENLAYGLKQRKAPQTVIEQRVKAAANVLGLNEVLYRKPKTLTAAQKQRVAIGRAIVREPALYLFDEPLAGLDEKLSGELLNVIINLQARMEGTFVYATKNVSEALTIGTRIAVLKNGIIQQIDTPANLYDYPANTYVAFTIGSPTINFYNAAKVTKTEEGTFVQEGSLSVKLSDKVLNRFETLSEYENTDKKLIAGIRPEDIDKNGNADPDRVYLFDSETRLTLLARDEGYKNTEFADSNYIPPTFKEEEEIAKKHKLSATQKKK